MLRTTSSTVELLVQRVAGEGNVTTPPQELPPPLPVRREAAVTRVLDPLAPLDVEPCGVSNERLQEDSIFHNSEENYVSRSAAT